MHVVIADRDSIFGGPIIVMLCVAGGQHVSLAKHSSTPTVSASQVLITSPTGVAVGSPTSTAGGPGATEPSAAGCACPFSFLVVLLLVALLM